MKLEQNRRLVTYYSLLTQMRVNGGNDYINLVNSIFLENVINKLAWKIMISK